MLHKMWDDVVAGPQPERGLGKFRKIRVDTNVKLADQQEDGSSSSKYERSKSMPVTGAAAAPSTPTTPGTPSPRSAGVSRNNNVWRSVFHPGSNLNTRSVGAHFFDKPVDSESTSPTTYDWLYSEDTRSKYH